VLSLMASGVVFPATCAVRFRPGQSIWNQFGYRTGSFTVLFCMELSTRRAQIAGIIWDVANGLWMNQVVGNLSDALGGLLKESVICFMIRIRYSRVDFCPRWPRPVRNL
jgi:hypothetical protein